VRRRRAFNAALIGGLFLLTSGGRAPTQHSDSAPTLALAGDVSLARTVRAHDPLAALRAVLGADATYANLESPLTNQAKQTSGIDLRADPARVSSLNVFTALGVENNHVLDGGEAGRAQSRAVLARNHILPVGRSVNIQTIGNVRVAWLAFFDDGVTPPPFKAIKTATASADFVIVGVHWGAEYQPTTPRQRSLGRALAGAGASLVVGSGPHVLQGHEFVGRSLVLYSLGNLLLDQPYPSARIGAVVRLTLGDLHAACAVPTLYRAGAAESATGEDAAFALERLGLPRCAG
jgi:poly-gamma-glutamate capsule biosynthesis protein CapA/YwtB (metallophosphatase superfamily)